MCHDIIIYKTDIICNAKQPMDIVKYQFPSKHRNKAPLGVVITCINVAENTLCYYKLVTIGNFSVWLILTIRKFSNGLKLHGRIFSKYYSAAHGNLFQVSLSSNYNLYFI